jgi:hypothetical protein
MASAATRGIALIELDSALDQFKQAVEAVPPEALHYLKPGDDYALGGLVFHVNAGIRHYAGVMDQILVAGFEAVEAFDPPGFWEEANAKAKEGLAPDERGPALDVMTNSHKELAQIFAGIPEQDWERLAPVTYKPGDEPYETSPVMLLGWVKDHYLEHVPHALELLDNWRAARTDSPDR